MDAARTLQQLVGNRADEEDLLQETYLRLLSAVQNFRGESRFRTFLYRVCAHVALSHLRWKRRRPEDPMAMPPEVQSPEQDPERETSRRQAVDLVEQALGRLKPKKRIVFVYYELWGMSRTRSLRRWEARPIPCAAAPLRAAGVHGSHAPVAGQSSRRGRVWRGRSRFRSVPGLFLGELGVHLACQPPFGRRGPLEGLLR